MLRIFPFLLPLLLASMSSLAQVAFVTKASSTSIGKNDLLEVSYEVQNGEIGEFTSPVFTGWKLIGGPNIRTSSLTVNGQKTTTAAYQYILKPAGTGKLILPGARASINGKWLNSNVLEVMVGSQISPGPLSVPGITHPRSADPEPAGTEDIYDGYLLREGENAREKISRNLFLKVTLSKTRCMEGEAIVADYQLFSRVSLNARITRSPSFTGFSSIDLHDAAGNDFEVVRMDGKVFKMHRVRKVQLYPLQNGKLRLEPVEIDATVQFRKVPSIHHLDNYDPYSPDNYITLPYTVKSEVVEVDVLPLPEANRPAGMQNAVGRFDLTARLLQNEIRRGQAGTLEVEISGMGNWAMVAAPRPSWPDGVEVYEPSITEKIDSQAVPAKGVRKYTFRFTSKNPGWITLSPVKFSYFDPWQKQYQTHFSDTLHLQVLAAQYTSEMAVPDPGAAVSPDITELFTDIVTIGFPLLAAVLMVIVMRRSRKRSRQILPPESPAPDISTPSWSTTRKPLHPASSVHIAPMQNPVEPGTTRQVANTPDPALNHEPYARVALGKKQLISLLQGRWHIPAGQQRHLGLFLQSKGMDADLSHRVEMALEQTDAWLYSPFREDSDADGLVNAMEQLTRDLSGLHPKT